ncbi:STM4015 family protein (plasmid) [Methylobacterium currus]|uniref:STM4015 family protein n=1 Tax=Methylobacterium currus TaxID=2051553 RepID=UPI001E5CE510|nr:STM4015 family protein [Methylobacterium currus]UHC19928.1 STM4015 family protein [Methylobacterium currus]
MPYENLTTFVGKPVEDVQSGTGTWDVARAVPRLRIEYDSQDSVPALLGHYAALPGTEATDALVIGYWQGDDSQGSSQAIVEALVSYAERFPNLRALFLGDIVSEENEISWINQSDLSALWPAFPHLEHLQVRGSNDLSLGRFEAPRLTTLILESGGLPRRVVQEALAAGAPELRHLELWLGTDEYGGDTTPEDFADLFAGRLFPKLETLALRDCAYADDLAAALAGAPVLERITTLDLSLGNLTDAGAEALLASPAVARLSRLDLHHHFLTDATMARLERLGPAVDLSERQEEEEYGGTIYRSIAVSE